jgi:DNA-binding transcriptional ArsR family regulator
MTAPAKVPLNILITALSHRSRWQVLKELAKGEPLPNLELARRIGVHPNALSKHTTLLRQAGLIERGFGNVYSIPARFLVPGQNAVDFGTVLLRLDDVK